MSELSPLEPRVARLISAYADRAPVDVDAMAMARFAAAGGADHGVSVGAFGRRNGTLVFLLVAMGLLVALAAGSLFLGGQRVEDGPEQLLAGDPFVAPYIGLPPVDAATSTPVEGELVLRYEGRVDGLGLDVHAMWLFADGRLIWRRNDESRVDAATRIFRPGEPTTAVIEQRLTPAGVARLRARALGIGVPPDENPARTGHLWGDGRVHDGTAMVAPRWTSTLPMDLADPGVWLPAGSWADQRLRGFVPSHMALCSDAPLETLLPRAAIATLASDPTTVDTPQFMRDCNRITVDVARVIADALEDAGFHRMQFWDAALPDRPYSYLEYQRGGWLDRVTFLPILPNGEAVTYGG
jgi:hypothetical protein